MLSFLNSLPFGEIITWATIIITAANVITVATPTRSDNMILDFISKIVNFLAVNFGNNKNADDVKK